ncbi:MAG: hypothetical protein ACK5KO_04625 [Arachnia sp.]
MSKTPQGAGGFDFDSVDFVTSDHHFGHARLIELAERPFSSVSEMNDALIANWNRVVGPTDTVLHLGDLAMGEREAATPPRGSRPLLTLGRRAWADLRQESPLP